MLNLRSRLSWQASSGEIDRGVIRGAALAAVLIILAVALGGHWLSFFDLPGLLIVTGGTFGATLVNFSELDLRRSWIALNQTLRVPGTEPRERIKQFVALAQRIRQDGMLVLEKASERTPDHFLKKALDLAVDGQSAVEVRRILDIEMKTSSERMARAVQVFETMGNFAPAMGLIGTLIGLIQMLGALEDPGAVGASMSVALVTTLYGAILANLVFLPLSGKIRNRGEEDLLVHALTIEGIVSLINNENSIMVEQRLQSFIPHALAA